MSWKGTNILFVGRFPRRVSEVKRKLEQEGIVVKTRISKKVNLVIVGHTSDKKVDEIKQLRLPMKTLEEVESAMKKDKREIPSLRISDPFAIHFETWEEEEISRWLENWNEGPKKGLLIQGNEVTESTKTRTIEHVVKQHKLPLYSIHTAMQRGSTKLRDTLVAACESMSLFSTRQVILLEDVDATCGSTDRNFLPLAIEVLQRTRNPVICTCSNVFPVKSLSTYCSLLKWKTVDSQLHLQLLPSLSPDPFQLCEALFSPSLSSARKEAAVEENPFLVSQFVHENCLSYLGPDIDTMLQMCDSFADGDLFQHYYLQEYIDHFSCMVPSFYASCAKRRSPMRFPAGLGILSQQGKTQRGLQQIQQLNPTFNDRMSLQHEVILLDDRLSEGLITKGAERMAQEWMNLMVHNPFQARESLKNLQEMATRLRFFPSPFQVPNSLKSSLIRHVTARAQDVTKITEPKRKKRKTVECENREQQITCSRLSPGGAWVEPNNLPTDVGLETM